MDKNENVYDNVIENVKFIDKTEINRYFGQEDNMNCLKSKQKNPIYLYLLSISPSDYKDNNLLYASYDDAKDKKEENNKESEDTKQEEIEKDNEKEKNEEDKGKKTKVNYLISLDTELVKNYNKNLEELKSNLLNHNYSIKVSAKTNISSKTENIPEKIIINKIKYDYDIALSNSSQNTKIQLESFISDETEEKIKNEIKNNFQNQMNKNAINFISKDIKGIKTAIEKIMEQINEENKKNNVNEPKLIPDDYLSEITLDENNHTKYFKEINLDEESILFLLDLLINTTDKSEQIIDILELSYNIYIFNTITKNEYKGIYKKISDKLIKGADLSLKKFRSFYFIKFFEDKDYIKKIYYPSTLDKAKTVLKYNNELNTNENLKKNIDKILEKFAPYSIPFKKIEYLLSEYIQFLNDDSEKISHYLDGFCFEEEVKNIILLENPNLIKLPNLHYILLNKEISFCEFDFICLLKKDEILNLNESMFERVAHIHNLKLLDKNINIKGLGLLFFEIKSSQHSSEEIILKLMKKVNFLYPFIKLYLEQTYKLKIEECVFYFAQVFDSKFNPKGFVIPEVDKILKLIKNRKINNICKIIFIHAETNIGQYNIHKLNDEIKNHKNQIDNLKIAQNDMKEQYDQLLAQMTQKFIAQEKEIADLKKLVMNKNNI